MNDEEMRKTFGIACLFWTECVQRGELALDQLQGKLDDAKVVLSEVLTEWHRTEGRNGTWWSQWPKR